VLAVVGRERVVGGQRAREAALLDLRPDHEEAARPTIGVERDGEKAWVPYDVIRRFASVDEAKAFAERHGIEDVALGVSEP
jgi:hypothetical protein